MSWWKEAHHGSILCGPTTSALLAQPALAYLDPATDLPLHSVTVIRDGLLVLDAFLGFPQFWNKNDLCSIAHKSFNVVYSFMLSRVCKPLLLL
jgi:hypothetical protein